MTEERRARGANLGSHPDDAPGPGAISGRDPARHHRRSAGIGAGLSHPEAETHDEEHGVARDQARQRREGGPPQHDSGQHAPRPDAVGEGAGRNLERAVGKKEEARDPSPLLRADLQAFLDAGSGDRDAHPIDVGDHREERQHADHAVLMLHVGMDYPRTAGAARDLFLRLAYGAAVNGTLVLHRQTPPTRAPTRA